MKTYEQQQFSDGDGKKIMMLATNMTLSQAYKMKRKPSEDMVGEIALELCRQWNSIKNKTDQQLKSITWRIHRDIKKAEILHARLEGEENARQINDTMANIVGTINGK